MAAGITDGDIDAMGLVDELYALVADHGGQLLAENLQQGVDIEACLQRAREL